MKYPIGLSFMNAQCETITIIGYYEVKGVLMYHFDNGELMTDENIDFYLSKQEKWTELKRKREIREVEEHAQMEQDELNLAVKRIHVNAYLNQFTGVKRVKIDTILSKEEYIKSEWITRYEHMEKLFKAGARAEIKTFSNMYNKRAKKEHITEYCIFYSENEFYSVTKTEYNYFNWMNDIK